jgi:hypothetical protein
MKPRNTLGLKTLLVTACLCFSDWVSSAEHAAPDGSRQIVATLYKDFAWEAMASSDVSDELFGPTLAEEPRQVLQKYFDAKLAGLIARDAACVAKHQGDECNLDLDLLFASQDPSVADLRIVALSPERVSVSFASPSDNQKFDLEYVTTRTAAGWRIKDVVYRNREDLSLTQLLSRKP